MTKPEVYKNTLSKALIIHLKQALNFKALDFGALLVSDAVRRNKLRRFYCPI